MKRITLVIALCCLPFITLAQQVKELTVTSAQASSQYPAEGRVKYDPGQAIDHNNKTAWFPQRTSRANKGEWIKLDLQQLSDIKEIKIINGWIESLRNWQHNSRVKTATITTSSGFSQQITLEDTRKVQRFTINAPESDWIKLTIDEIYQGNSWNQESGITQFTVVGISAEERHALQLAEEKHAAQQQLQAEEKKQREARQRALQLAHYKDIEKEVAALHTMDNNTGKVEKLSALGLAEHYEDSLALLSKQVPIVVDTMVKDALASPNNHDFVSAVSVLLGSRFHPSTNRSSTMPSRKFARQIPMPR